MIKLILLCCSKRCRDRYYVWRISDTARFFAMCCVFKPHTLDLSASWKPMIFGKRSNITNLKYRTLMGRKNRDKFVTRGVSMSSVILCWMVSPHRWRPRFDAEPYNFFWTPHTSRNVYRKFYVWYLYHNEYSRRKQAYKIGGTPYVFARNTSVVRAMRCTEYLHIVHKYCKRTNNRVDDPRK